MNEQTKDTASFKLVGDRDAEVVSIKSHSEAEGYDSISMGWFRLNLSFEKSQVIQTVKGRPAEFQDTGDITERFQVEIYFRQDGCERDEVLVGELRGLLMDEIDIERADAESQEAYDIVHALSLTKRASDITQLILVERIEIQPPYRGRQLGHAALQLLIERFEHFGAGLCALKAFPLQFLHDKTKKEERKIATQKLIQYYRSLGFRLVKGSDDIMVFEIGQRFGKPHSKDKPYEAASYSD